MDTIKLIRELIVLRDELDQLRMFAQSLAVEAKITKLIEGIQA